MISRTSEIYGKEIVSIKDGCKLGGVNDIEIDTKTGHAEAIVIHGRARLFGLLGRDDDFIIAWGQIEVIGEDTILVNCESCGRDNIRKYRHPGKCKSLIKSFFE